jgi:transcriptional regulator with XRE-family HTH domain
MGEEIRKLRDARSLKQSTVAQALGISQPSYHRVETGQASVTIDFVALCSEYFGEDLKGMLVRVADRRNI